MIGSSGQNIQDVLRFTNLEDPIDIMDKILDWGHQIPSAPDTIRKYFILCILYFICYLHIVCKLFCLIYS